MRRTVHEEPVFVDGILVEEEPSRRGGLVQEVSRKGSCNIVRAVERDDEDRTDRSI